MAEIKTASPIRTRVANPFPGKFELLDLGGTAEESRLVSPEKRPWGFPWLALKKSSLEAGDQSTASARQQEELAGKIRTPEKPQQLPPFPGTKQAALSNIQDEGDLTASWSNYSPVVKQELFTKDWEELSAEERSVVMLRAAQGSFSAKKTLCTPQFSAHVTGARNLPCSKSYIKVKLFDQGVLLDCFESPSGCSPNPLFEIHHEYRVLQENQTPDDMLVRFEVYDAHDDQLVGWADKLVQGLDGFRVQKWAGALQLDVHPDFMPKGGYGSLSPDRMEAVKQKVKAALESPMLFCRINFSSSEFLREKYIFDTTGNTSNGLGEIIE
eukprot:gb/GEZN01004714.1/.p1 GENE.gb/GEZN01004714.1/~~gb/GEZN01004714.1/.p1  ORF type:complete len:326 (+),score=56.17 gb/GEZN01004714.1/:54-1031(+)